MKQIVSLSSPVIIEVGQLKYTKKISLNMPFCNFSVALNIPLCNFSVPYIDEEIPNILNYCNGILLKCEDLGKIYENGDKYKDALEIVEKS